MVFTQEEKSQGETSSSSSSSLYYRDENGVLYELKPVQLIIEDGETKKKKEDEDYEDLIVRGSDDSKIDMDSVDSSNENFVYRMQRRANRMVSENKTYIIRSILFLMFVGYSVYFGFALAYNLEWSIALIVFTSLAVFFIVYGFIRDRYGSVIYAKVLQPIGQFLNRFWPIIKWFFYPAIFIIIILYLTLDVIREIKQIQSLSGMVIFFLIMYITSKYPDKVNWRPVIWGFILQLVMAILVLRWDYGYIAIKFISDEIVKFIMYGFEGAAVVFADPFMILHPFVFMGMPLLIYMGSVTAICYYLGWTQLAACKLGWLMQVSMGTTAIESLNVAANIFLNGMDTMLMLRFYLDKLTRSEFNCLLVGNHATVAGFVFALFVLFGAPPQHLLSAAVMSAPATIAICKLNYPETEESTTNDMDDVQLTESDEVNVFEAGANGAAVAAKTVASVVASYIAFMSILAFINATLSWLGGRVGFEELRFELICSYIMWPIAFIIGIDFDECQEAAKLIGLKIFATELMAYQELGRSVDAGLLNPRNQAITTYALCGFSSVSTLAIAVGVWNTICPQRVKQMASSMFRVMVEANISCFMTACVAGLFYSEEMIRMVDTGETSGTGQLIAFILGLIPGYKDLMGLVGM